MLFLCLPRSVFSIRCGMLFMSSSHTRRSIESPCISRCIVSVCVHPCMHPRNRFVLPFSYRNLCLHSCIDLCTHLCILPFSWLGLSRHAVETVVPAIRRATVRQRAAAPYFESLDSLPPTSEAAHKARRAGVFTNCYLCAVRVHARDCALPRICVRVCVRVPVCVNDRGRFGWVLSARSD